MIPAFYSVSGGKGGRIHIEYGNRSFIKVIRYLSVEGRGRGMGRLQSLFGLQSSLDLPFFLFFFFSFSFSLFFFFLLLAELSGFGFCRRGGFTLD